MEGKEITQPFWCACVPSNVKAANTAVSNDMAWWITTPSEKKHAHIDGFDQATWFRQGRKLSAGDFLGKKHELKSCNSYKTVWTYGLMNVSYCIAQTM